MKPFTQSDAKSAIEMIDSHMRDLTNLRKQLHSLLTESTFPPSEETQYADQFINDTYDLVPGHEIPITEVLTEFESWFKDHFNRDASGSDKWFLAKALSVRGITARQSGHKRVRVRSGIKLKNANKGGF